jgi:hypothetical protein
MPQMHCPGVNYSRHFGFDRPSPNFPYTLRMIQTIKQITNSVPSSPYPNMVVSYEPFQSWKLRRATEGACLCSSVRYDAAR